MKSSEILRAARNCECPEMSDEDCDRMGQAIDGWTESSDQMIRETGLDDPAFRNLIHTLGQDDSAAAAGAIYGACLVYRFLELRK